MYIELIGGKQPDLGLSIVREIARGGEVGIALAAATRTPPRPRLTDAERAADLSFIASLGTNPVWRDYLSEG